MQITTIGLDLVKHWFRVHGVDANGHIVVRKQLWHGVFGDPVVATAILDRLLHYSQVITIRGDSYRLREKRRSGLIKAIPSPNCSPCRPSTPLGSAPFRKGCATVLPARHCRRLLTSMSMSRPPSSRVVSSGID